jgi:2,3-diaminopropionate biosynthesis protein SbnB
VLIIGHRAVREILDGREPAVLDVIRAAYRGHDEGVSALPHSAFLRFPGDRRNRIIALPAFAGEAPAAGVKWIASFPGNLDHGLARASAVVVLNSLSTGHPEAVLEAGLVSARRTAASAAVAAELLTRDAPPRGIGLVGCGVINLEVLRFLATVLPAVEDVCLYDADPQRAAGFADRCREVVPAARITVAGAGPDVLAAHPLTSIATTATEPHLTLDACPPGAVVLHVSLRDIVPAAILDCTNVVDDADHVCREGTSLHLAERLCGHRRFIHAPIGALLRGTARVPERSARPVVFSPFGLGVLDIALAEFVRAEAARRGLGTPVEDFLPEPVPTAG